MRNLFYFLALALLASCSSAKYAAHFRKSENTFPAGYGEVVRPSVTPAIPEQYVASTATQPVVTGTSSRPVETPVVQMRKTYLQMNASQRRTLRHELKTEIKKYVKIKKDMIAPAPRGPQSWDYDAKLATVFGAIAVTAFIIGNDVLFIIGVVAAVIGAVFFIKWIMKQ